MAAMTHSKSDLSATSKNAPCGASQSYPIATLPLGLMRIRFSVFCLIRYFVVPVTFTVCIPCRMRRLVEDRHLIPKGYSLSSRWDVPLRNALMPILGEHYGFTQDSIVLRQWSYGIFLHEFHLHMRLRLADAEQSQSAAAITS